MLNSYHPPAKCCHIVTLFKKYCKRIFEKIENNPVQPFTFYSIHSEWIFFKCLNTLFDKQSQNKTKAPVLFALTHPYRCVKINILTFSLAPKSNRCKCYYTKDIKTRIYTYKHEASSFSERQSFALFGMLSCVCADTRLSLFLHSKKIQTVKTALLATQNL